MKLQEKLEVSRRISETFNLVRFLMKHPKFLRHIHRGATVEILPKGIAVSKSQYNPRKTQYFSSETLYQPL